MTEHKDEPYNKRVDSRVSERLLKLVQNVARATRRNVSDVVRIALEDALLPKENTPIFPPKLGLTEGCGVCLIDISSDDDINHKLYRAMTAVAMLDKKVILKFGRMQYTLKLVDDP